MPQDEILSGHWDHAFCTSFTAIVHFKDSKDKFLKKKRFIIVSNYMNHDKYVVLKFLNIISDEFSKSQPDLIISKRFLHSDGTAQHFKQKYSLCTMTLMDGNIEWDFSATSHGKRDIDGLGSVVLVSREYVNKPLPAPLIHKTLLTLLNMLLLFAQQSPFFIA